MPSPVTGPVFPPYTTLKSGAISTSSLIHASLGSSSIDRRCNNVMQCYAIWCSPRPLSVWQWWHLTLSCEWVHYGHSSIASQFVIIIEHSYSASQRFRGTLDPSLSFIHIEQLHSFKKNYSESLPTPARLQRTAFRPHQARKTERDMVLGKRRSSRGKPFQIEGPTTEKARFCIMKVRAKGTRRRPCSDERRDREPIAQRTRQQSSQR